MDYEYNLGKFIEEQQKNGNKIKECGFDSRGAWEGCTGIIIFEDGTRIDISDEVHIYDKDNNEIEF